VGSCGVWIRVELDASTLGADCNIPVAMRGTLQGRRIGLCSTATPLRVFLKLRYNALVIAASRIERKVCPLLKEKLVPSFEPLPFP
jgi:hypothetical protein